METSKTIKIFLASSDELKTDRYEFGNLIRRLDNIYEKRGIRIQLFEWEDHDAAYNGGRKQDEYNEHIRESDMFLALFQQKAGKYTIEEFKVATEEFKIHSRPKIYTYVKELHAEEQETPELTEFKELLFNELGHYWCRYANTDTMQLHFVMQLQLVENKKQNLLKVENGTVLMEDTVIARLDNVPFAALNKEYNQLKEELLQITNTESRLLVKHEKYPDDPDFKQELEEIRLRKVKVQNKQKEYEENLFQTALTIARLSSTTCSERLRKAIHLFEQGDNRGADAILDLDDIAQDVNNSRHIEEQGEQLIEEALAGYRSSVDAYLLKAHTVLTRNDLPDRQEQACQAFEKAIKLADEKLEAGEKLDGLMEYLAFLTITVQIKRGLPYAEQLEHFLQDYIDFPQELPEKEKQEVIENYVFITLEILVPFFLSGRHFNHLQDILNNLLEMVKQSPSVTIENKIKIFNFLGVYYQEKHRMQEALFYFQEAERLIQEEKDRKGSTELTFLLVQSLNNIALIHTTNGESDKALELYGQALTIAEQYKKEDGFDLFQGIILVIKTNQAITLLNQKKFEEAEALARQCTEEAEIMTEHIGVNTINLGSIWNLLGRVLSFRGKTQEACECLAKAYEIQHNLARHEDLAVRFLETTFLNDLARIHAQMGQVNAALEECRESLESLDELVTSDPEAYSSHFLRYSREFITYLKQSGRTEECYRWLSREMEVAKRYYQINPAEGLYYLARSYENYVNIKFTLQDHSDMEPVIAAGLKLFDDPTREYCTGELIYKYKLLLCKITLNVLSVNFDEKLLAVFPPTIQFFKEALQEGFTDVFTSLLQALCFHSQFAMANNIPSGSVKEAIQLLEQYPHLKVDDATIYIPLLMNYAADLYKNQQYETALKWLNKVKERIDDLPEPMKNIYRFNMISLFAFIYTASGEQKTAINYYEEVKAMNTPELMSMPVSSMTHQLAMKYYLKLLKHHSPKDRNKINEIKRILKQDRQQNQLHLKRRKENRYMYIALSVIFLILIGLVIWAIFAFLQGSYITGSILSSILIFAIWGLVKIHRQGNAPVS